MRSFMRSCLLASCFALAAPLVSAQTTPSTLDQSQTTNLLPMAEFYQTGLAQSFQTTAATISGAGVQLWNPGDQYGHVTISLWDGLPTQGGTSDFDRLIHEINFMLSEIERLMNEVKGVCDNVAHDLRTPLTRLLARLERAHRRAGSTQEYASAVDEATAASQYAPLRQSADWASRSRMMGLAFRMTSERLYCCVSIAPRKAATHREPGLASRLSPRSPGCTA